jgi:hypothetical protein
MRAFKTSDWILAALMTVAGAVLMLENILAGPDAELAHPLSTQTWLMLPAFVLVTVPILWRRRNVLGATAVTVGMMGLHVLAFDWVTRCGVGLPLAFALGYAIARYAGSVRHQLAGLAGVALLLIVTLIRDSSAGFEALVIAIPGVILFYGAGLLVQTRVSRKSAPAVERIAA